MDKVTIEKNHKVLHSLSRIIKFTKNEELREIAKDSFLYFIIELAKQEKQNINIYKEQLEQLNFSPKQIEETIDKMLSNKNAEEIKVGEQKNEEPKVEEINTKGTVVEEINTEEIRHDICNSTRKRCSSCGTLFYHFHTFKSIHNCRFMTHIGNIKLIINLYFSLEKHVL